MENFPESEKHFGRVGVEFGGAVDFDLGDVGGGEGEGEVGGGEVAVGGGHLFFFSFSFLFFWVFGGFFCFGGFLDGGRCCVFFSLGRLGWKGNVCVQ